MGATINLASKYSKHIDKKFTEESFLKGKTSDAYDLVGVKSLTIYTPQTVELNDYQRSGTSRYGDVKEMGDTVQELTMTQDKSFSISIDKGNQNEQMQIKKAGVMMNMQLAEQVTPAMDKYAFKRIALQTGQTVEVASTSDADAIKAVNNAATLMDEESVPQNNRYLFVGAAFFQKIANSDQYIKNETLGKKYIQKGEMGELFGLRVVKMPSKYLPTNCHFIAAHKIAIVMPVKIRETKLHQDPPGISGNLLEGRFNYDCFILEHKAVGVVTGITAGQQQALPVITLPETIGSGNMTIASAGNSEIRYTLDGSDPRYSKNAYVYSGATATTGWELPVKVRAVAYSATKFTSDVAEATKTA